MKLEIYYDGHKVDSISGELRSAYEERVEMQLIEALEPHDQVLSRFDYTINICFSEDYESLTIFLDGLTPLLTKITEDSISRVLYEKPVYAYLE